MANETDKAVAEAAKSLAESNKRIARASSDLAKATGTIGEAIGNSEGVKRISGMIDSIPFAGIAKGIGNVVFQKMKQKKEEKLLRDSLKMSKQEFAIVKKQQELAKAQEEQLKALKDSAEKLGLNADAIIGVDENNIAVLSKSMEKALGMGEMTDSFTKLTMALNEKDKEAMSGAVEQEMKAEEQRNAFARNRDLIEAINNIDIEVPEEDDKSTSWLGKLWEGIKGLGPMLLGGLTTLGTTIVGAVMAAGRGVWSRLGTLRRGLGRVFTKGLGAVTSGITRLGGAAGNAVAGAGRAAAGAGRAAASGAGKVAGNVARLGKGLVKAIPGIGLVATAAFGLFDGITAGVEEYNKSGSVGSAIKEGISGTLSGLTFGLVSQETFSGAFTKIGEFATSAVDSVTSVAKNAYESLPSWEETSTAITNTATALNSKFEEWTGINLGESFSTGIATLKTSISDTASALKNKFEEVTGLSVPTNFEETKQFVVDAATKLNDKFAEVTGIDIGETFTGLKDSVSTMATNLSSKFTELTGIEIPSFEDIKTNISALGTNLSNKFTELTGMELPTFDDITSKFDDLSSSLSDTFSNVTDKVGGWFSSWFSGDDPEARMAGGPVKAGAVYKINEAGQEMFIPNTDGYIANASRTQSLLAAGMDSNVQQSAAPVIINRGGSTTVNNNNPTMPLPIPITNRGADWATSGSF